MKFFKTIQFFVLAALVGVTSHVSAVVFNAQYLIGPDGKKVLVFYDVHDQPSENPQVEAAYKGIKRLGEKNVRVLVEGTRSFESDEKNLGMFRFQKLCVERGIAVDNVDLRVRRWETDRKGTSALCLGASCDYQCSMMENFFFRNSGNEALEKKRSLLKEKAGGFDLFILYREAFDLFRHVEDERERRQKMGAFLDQRTKVVLDEVYGRVDVVEKGKEADYSFEKTYYIRHQIRRYFEEDKDGSLVENMSFLEVEAVDKILNSKEEYCILHVGGYHAKSVADFLLSQGFKEVGDYYDVYKEVMPVSFQESMKTPNRSTNKTEGLLSRLFQGKTVVESTIEDFFNLVLEDKKRREARRFWKNIGLISGGLVVTAAVGYGLWRYLKGK